VAGQLAESRTNEIRCATEILFQSAGPSSRKDESLLTKAKVALAALPPLQRYVFVLGSKKAEKRQRGLDRLNEDNATV
jgi:hypothetical protein